MHKDCLFNLALDYEQSLFFLSPSNIEQNAQECTRAWLKARDGTGTKKRESLFFFSGFRPRFSYLAASPLDARTGVEELKKNRDCLQSNSAPKWLMVMSELPT